MSHTDKYKAYIKKEFRPSYFYCEVCGDKILLVKQCSKCSVKHIVEEYERKSYNG